jgi:hypothetical protein
LQSQSHNIEPLHPTVIEADGGPFLSCQLQPYVGFVVDVQTECGGSLSGVIVAVTSSALVLEGWDRALHQPNGELLPISLDVIKRITVP